MSQCHSSSPLVSVIIPLHNGAGCIEATLQSVLSQHYSHLEVLVVENGSVDNGIEVVRSINDRRVVLFTIPEANAALARNYGFRNSSGQYVMFLDADDLISPDKIALQVSLLQANSGEYVASCGWAKFWSHPMEAKPVAQKVWTIRDPVEWCCTAFTGGGMMITGCWLIPRSVIDRAGLWNPRFSLHDDGEFMCRVLLASEGNLYCGEVMLYYRQSIGSLSRQNHSRKAAESALGVYHSYRDTLLARHDIPEVRWALTHNYATFLYTYHPLFPDLLLEAKKGISDLGITHPPIVGGKRFQQMARITGLYRALRFKSCISRFYRS